MTNDQAPMTSQTANGNDECPMPEPAMNAGIAAWSLPFRHSLVIGAWSLVIQWSLCPQTATWHTTRPGAT
jgi:hypothetical protein